MNSLISQLKTQWNKPAVRIIIGVVAVLILVALFRPRSSSDSVDPENAHICRVQRGDLVISILQSGELKAKTSRDILNEAHRDAKIVEIVEDGSTVTNGQLLFELESSQLMERYLDQQSDVAEAEAGLKQAQESLEIARLKGAADLESAELKVDFARLDLKKYNEVEYKQQLDKAQSDIYLAEQELKKARSELKGTQELFEKGYANQDELDSDRLGVERKEIEVKNRTTNQHILINYTSIKRRKELENAVTNAESAFERLKKSITSDIESKEASIESKKTRLEIEKNQLTTREEQFANTKVYADFEGQVFYPKERNYGGSQKIEKGATVNFRQRILSFPDLSAWDLKVGIPEAMIDKVAIGQDAVATLDAVPGLVLRGRIAKVSAVPDSQHWFSSGVKTYTIMVDVTSNPDAKLKPGMSATIEIVTDQLRDVLYVPIQAVVSREDKHYVYAVHRGRRKLTEVSVGKFNTQYIEVIEGLEEGGQLLLYADVELESDAKLKKSPLSEESRSSEAQAEQG